jgi:hypothetical protein
MVTRIPQIQPALIPWRMQFWFVIVILKYMKFVSFLMIINCPYIIFLSCLTVMKYVNMLCSLLLLIGPFQVLTLFCKLWLRITSCPCVRNHYKPFLAPQILMIRSSFVWWIPQGTYIFHLSEDWGRASLCNGRRLSHYDECFSKFHLQILVVMTANCNYLIIIRETLDFLENSALKLE